MRFLDKQANEQPLLLIEQQKQHDELEALPDPVKVEPMHQTVREAGENLDHRLCLPRPQADETDEDHDEMEDEDKIDLFTVDSRSNHVSDVQRKRFLSFRRSICLSEEKENPRFDQV